MIYDVLDAFDAEMRDETTGLNALQEAVALARGQVVPHIQEFYTWDLSKLPSQMNMPAVQLVWENGGSIGLKQQGKRNADWRLALNYWTDVSAETGDARKDIAIFAQAATEFVEYMALTDTYGILEIRELAMMPSSWTVSGRLFTYLGVTFRVKERDENA